MSFHEDLAFTNRARCLLESGLYPTWAYEGRFVSLAQSAGSMALQRRAHIDVVMQTAPGTSITIEEKIVRRKFSAFAIETHSNLERGEADGWIYTSTADQLVYAFMVPVGLECYVLPLAPLRHWFASRERDFPLRDIANGPAGNPLYHTRLRLVPIDAVGSPMSVHVVRG